MIYLILAISTAISSFVQGQCPITNGNIQIDTGAHLQLADRDNLELVIEGITTGGIFITGIWMRNGSAVDRNTPLPGGSFFNGGGDTIHTGNPPCEEQMYRIALLVRGYAPGSYSYTVTNTQTPGGLTSPTFLLQDPGPPTNIVLRQISDRRVEATWTPPAGFPNATYRVYLNTSDVINGGTPVTGTTYTTGSLSIDFTATFRIRATTGTYLSIPAVSETLTVMQNVIIIEVSISSVTATSAMISFTQPSDSLPVDDFTATLTSTTCTGVPIRTESSTSNSITVDNLEANIQYSVSVTATNNMHNLMNTVSTSLTTSETAPTGSPGVPTAATTMSTNITLTWTEIDCLDRNGVITSNIIQYGEGTSTDRTINTQSSTTTHVITGLEPFTQYTFIVAGVNSVGTGPFSGAGIIRTAEDSPSGSPGVPAASVTTSTSITLSWAEIDFSQKNGIITNYIIQYGEGTTRNRIINTQSNATTHVITGLKPFTQYTFTVAGVNSVGTGPFSDASGIVRTAEAIPSGKPTVLTAGEITSNNITLIWTAIEISERNGIITSYVIQYGEGTTRDRTINTQSNATTHVITGLKPFTLYTFTVAGVNSVGTGPFSDASGIIRTAEDTPSGSPGVPTADVIMSTNITLTWTEIGISDRNGIITRYIIQYREETTRDRTINTQSNATTHLITGLKPFTQYTFTVAGVNSVGTGPPSGASGIIRTAEDTPSGRPGIPTAAQVFSTSINLTWTEINISERNGIIINYIIQYGEGTIRNLNVSTLSNATTHVITGLKPFTQYTFSIAGVNSIDAGPFSNSSDIIRTTERPPTGSPGIPTASVIMSTNITLTWTEIEVSERNGVILSYIIHYGEGTTRDRTINTQSSATTHVITGLKPFTQYTFTVAGVNNVTFGPFSNATGFIRTSQDSPTEVRNLKTGATFFTVTLTWDVPQQLNGLLSYYSVQFSVNRTRQESETTNNTNFTISNLTPNTLVSDILVTATTGGGDGPSATANDTFTRSRPGRVTDVKVEVLTDTSVRVSWDNTGFEDISEFIIYYRLTDNRKRQAEMMITAPASSTSVTISGLVTGGQYIFEVVASIVEDGQPVLGARIALDPVVVTTSSPSSIPIPPIIGGIFAALVVLIVVILIILTIYFYKAGYWCFKSAKYKTGSSYRYTPKNEVLEKTDEHLYGNVGFDFAPLIDEFPENTVITEGQEITFKVQVSGKPTPTLTWKTGGKELVSNHAVTVGNDGTLMFPSTEMDQSGVYTLEARNSAGKAKREVKLQVQKEWDKEQPNGGTGSSNIKPIPLHQFGEYVAQNHSNNNKGFRAQFEGIYDGEDKSKKVGLRPEFKKLNRFVNITVYDDNRIELTPIPGHENCQGTFINASYIDGSSKSKKFIAAQGPNPASLVDFWRMIWQEKPPIIVMVTNLQEGNKTKCEQYWPDTGSTSFGPFKVTITENTILTDFIIRTLQVSFEGNTFKLTHFHFIAWPDHGVPEYASPMLAFHRRIQAAHKGKKGPILVHCSAGVGRTGTFISIDNILEHIQMEQVVNILGIITKIRHQRMKMVQNLDQYIFLHDAILESVRCGDTQISAANLRVILHKYGKLDPQTGTTTYQSQFDVLDQVSPKVSEAVCTTASRYPDKNRSMKYLPSDKFRVILTGESPDYIHAVFAHGYKHQKAYIIAENPMVTTVPNMLKVLYNRNIGAVVMLSDLEENGQETCAKYWPDVHQKGQLGEFTVELISEEILKGFTIRNISIVDGKSQKAHQVIQFHITCWQPDGQCSSLRSVVDTIDEMFKVQRKTGNKPVFVHCSDTVTRSGMFCALATIIDRCKTEGVVDVFQVVKALRIQKPGAVPTVNNYQTIYDATLTFLDSFDTYANFQM